MARSHLLLLPLLITVLAGGPAATAVARRHPPEGIISFIRSSCKSTRYPHLCEHSLSSYTPIIRRSPRCLAHVALTISLHHAQSASAFVHRLSSGTAGAKAVRSRQAGAIQDCIETMSDSVDQLRQSIREMRHMGRAGKPSFFYHLSNIQTWVSAALTDETTCLDGFSDATVDAAVKAAIQRKFNHVARVTSNALALVNNVVARKH